MIATAALTEFLLDYAGWLAALSVLSLLLATLGGAWFIAAMPADYFVARRRQRDGAEHPVLRLVLTITKNIIGLLLILAGLLMLVMPGQGLLTILAGLLLTNFPGKYRLERRLARQKRVLATLNWIRRRKGVPPFVRPGAAGD